jgi:hypothetical protein
LKIKNAKKLKKMQNSFDWPRHTSCDIGGSIYTAGDVPGGHFEQEEQEEYAGISRTKAPTQTAMHDSSPHVRFQSAPNVVQTTQTMHMGYGTCAKSPHHTRQVQFSQYSLPTLPNVRHLECLTSPTTLPENTKKECHEITTKEEVIDRLLELTRSLPRESLIHSQLLKVDNVKSASDVDSDSLAQVLEEEDDVSVIPVTPKTQLEEAFKFVEKLENVSHIHDVPTPQFH